LNIEQNMNQKIPQKMKIVPIIEHREQHNIEQQRTAKNSKEQQRTF